MVPALTQIYALQQLQENLPLQKAAIEIESQLLMYRYDSLIKAGFQENQAMEILKCQLKT